MIPIQELEAYDSKREPGNNFVLPVLPTYVYYVLKHAQKQRPQPINGTHSKLLVKMNLKKPRVKDFKPKNTRTQSHRPRRLRKRNSHRIHLEEKCKVDHLMIKFSHFQNYRYNYWFRTGLLFIDKRNFVRHFTTKLFTCSTTKVVRKVKP